MGPINSHFTAFLEKVDRYDYTIEAHIDSMHLCVISVWQLFHVGKIDHTQTEQTLSPNKRHCVHFTNESSSGV